MAAKQENPFGKGGSGAPLVNKNGQVIASRKPDPSQVQPYETRDNNNQNFIGIRGNNRSNSIGNTGIAQSFQDQFSQILENRDFNKAKQLQQQQQMMYPPGGSNIPGGYGAGTQQENGNNYNRSNNKRLLQMENESKEDQMKRAKQRNEISAALKEQMEEKERQKKLLKSKEAEEELRIEERIKKDREDIEKQLKEEEQIKKNKTQQLAQENQQLILQQQQQRQQQQQQSQPTPIKQHKGFQENSNFNYNNNNSFNNNNIITNQNKTTNPDSLDMQKTQLSMNFGIPSKILAEQQQTQQNLTQQQQQLLQLQLQSQQLSMRFAPRLTYSSEQRSRDIIPELEGLKQQIQDEYKRIQIDMHRAKIENCQAIDDRNKQSAGAAIFSKDIQNTDPSSNSFSFNNNTYLNSNINSSNYPYSSNNNYQFPQQARSMSGYAARGAPSTAPQKVDFREQSLYQQKQQISQLKSDQLSMSKTNIEDEYQLRNQNVNSARDRNSRDGDGNASFQNEQPLEFGKNSLLGGETKMIPMDLIDRLRQNDQLTMSQLINYDQNSNDNKVALGNSMNQNGINSNNNHNKDNKWEIPTINSDLGHEIDKILISQTEQAQGGLNNTYYSKQIDSNKQYSSQSKAKPETAFNIAAKGILDSQSKTNKFQKQQQPQSEESLADRINSDFNAFNTTNNNNFRSNAISMNNTYSDKWKNNNNQQEYNENQFNNINYIDSNDNKSVESNELSMTELQEKLLRDNISGNGLLEDTKSNQDFATRDRVYEEPRRRKSNISASSQTNKGSDILMYSSRSSLSQNEDSDEIKKQKALREIKERFNLSTVHEDQNEKTRQLSTLLETGKYQDNRELYESLKLVDDPDFQKLDDLIKQFKSSQLLEGKGKK